MRARRRVALVATVTAALSAAAPMAADRTFRVGAMCAGRNFEFTSFKAELAKAGFIEGRNLVLQQVAARSRLAADLEQAASELVADKVDVITTWCGSPGAVAARRVTSQIPIVFNAATDPVALGLVASLAKPGGNLTGISSRANQQAAKQLQLLVQVKPGIRQVAAIFPANASQLPWFDNYRGVLERAAQQLSISLRTIAVADDASLEQVFEQLRRNRIDAVFVITGVLSRPGFDRKAHALALAHQLPSSSGTDPNTLELGALIGSASFPDLGPVIARYVVSILDGKKPGDLPVEQTQPTGHSVNLRIARALGLTIPTALMIGATEVLE